MSTTTITIQPGQPGEGMDYNVRKPLPYPFHIDVATGNCTRGRGTDDLGDVPAGAEPWRLLGFQRGDTQTLIVMLQGFTAQPERAVGLCPVFLGHDGAIFSLSTPITSVHDNRPAVTESASR